MTTQQHLDTIATTLDNDMGAACGRALAHERAQDTPVPALRTPVTEAEAYARARVAAERGDDTGEELWIAYGQAIAAADAALADAERWIMRGDPC